MSDMFNKHRPEDEIGEGAQSLVNTLRVAFVCLRVVIVCLLVAYLFSGVFSFRLRENEQAYVLHFGEISRNGDGTPRIYKTGELHWAWPKPIDKIVIVPIGESRSVTTGDAFWFKSSISISQPQEQINAEREFKPGDVGYLITADENIVHNKWNMNYYVNDPVKYTSHYANPESIVQSVLENAVVIELAKTPIDDAIKGKAIVNLRHRVNSRVQQILAGMDMGVEVKDNDVFYVSFLPPENTIDSFNKVLNAEQQKIQRIEEARGYSKQLHIKTLGQEQRILAEAEAYKQQVVDSVEADAKYLQDILKTMNEDYKTAPETMLLSLYTDTLSDALKNVDETYVIYAKKNGARQELRLRIGERPHKADDK
jgi:regulator of protease activity HflC (stomatin/prohibitin superfamily)